MCFRKLLGIAPKIPNHFRKRPCGKSKSLFATSQVLNFRSRLGLLPNLNSCLLSIYRKLIVFE